jgi:DNA-binding IclR family transcriptional regulator
MRELTEQTRESCHLSVIHGGHLLVLAQEESPARLRLSVEIGATFPLLHTVSGRVLLAHLPEVCLAEILEHDPDYGTLSPDQQAVLTERLALIRERGYETAVSETIEGVIDVAMLVGTGSSQVQAAVAISSLTRNRDSFVADVLPALRQATQTIGRSAGIVV